MGTGCCGERDLPGANKKTQRTRRDQPRSRKPAEERKPQVKPQAKPQAKPPANSEAEPRVEPQSEPQVEFQGQPHGEQRVEPQKPPTEMTPAKLSVDPSLDQEALNEQAERETPPRNVVHADSPVEDNLDEPEQYSKVYITKLGVFVPGWQSEILKAKQATEERGEGERVPFLISMCQDKTGNYALIFTKPWEGAESPQPSPAKPGTLLKRLVERPFRPRSTQDNTFLPDLQAFLEYAPVLPLLAKPTKTISSPSAVSMT
jgi:hypothetical protein